MANSKWQIRKGAVGLGAGGGQLSAAGWVYWVFPVAVLLDEGADDEGVGVGEERFDLRRGYAGADQDWELGCGADFFEMGWVGRAAGAGAGDDDGVCAEELGGVDGVGQGEVG